MSENWKDQIIANLKESLDQNQLTDMTFVFKSNNLNIESSVPAHKLVLSALSPVFKRMFTGSLPEGKQVEINDPQIDVENFKTFIQYFYSGKVDLNLENAPQQAYLAHKYDMKPLENACADFFKQKVSRANAYEILEIADRYNIQALKKNCLDLIINDAEVHLDEFFPTLSCAEVIEAIDHLHLQPCSLIDWRPRPYLSQVPSPPRPTCEKYYNLVQAVKKWLQVNAVGKIQSLR